MSRDLDRRRRSFGNRLRSAADRGVPERFRLRVVAERASRRNPRPARRLHVLPGDTCWTRCLSLAFAERRPESIVAPRPIKRSPPSAGISQSGPFDPFRCGDQNHLVPGTGIEPATARLSVWCSTSELTALKSPLRTHHGTHGTDSGRRMNGSRKSRAPLDRRPQHLKLAFKETPAGVEPAPCCFAGSRQTVWRRRPPKGRRMKAEG